MEINNTSIVNFSWIMNVKAMEANKFCIFSCRERENDPEESFQGSGRNIIVIMPFSEYSTHSSPLFCVWKCSHESSSMLLDEAVTSTAPLCLFLWMHTESNSSLSECNYGNFWRFVGSSVTAV